MLSTEEYLKEVENLVGMIDSLRLIKDKGLRTTFEREVRTTFNLLLKKIKND